MLNAVASALAFSLLEKAGIPAGAPRCQQQFWAEAQVLF
jgi:hypothetical protein